MAALVVTLLGVPSAQASTRVNDSGAAVGIPAVSSSALSHRVISSEPRPCVSRLRHAIVNRRAATWHWQNELGIFRTRTARRARETTSCAYLRWIKGRWARDADRHYHSWIDSFTLHEHPYTGTTDPWPAAVNEVQRVFPGSRNWVLSCSDAEGWSSGLTYWQTFGGGRYYPGFEDRYVVGGPGQFKYPTFAGMFRRGVEYAISKGYRVPTHLRRSSVTAWRSPLGQAIAMAAAYSLGLRASHWSASWGRGC